MNGTSFGEAGVGHSLVIIRMRSWESAGTSWTPRFLGSCLFKDLFKDILKDILKDMGHPSRPLMSEGKYAAVVRTNRTVLRRSVCRLTKLKTRSGSRGRPTDWVPRRRVQGVNQTLDPTFGGGFRRPLARSVLSPYQNGLRAEREVPTLPA